MIPGDLLQAKNKIQVGVVLQIDDETCMTQIITKSGLIGWGNTWDFIPVQNPVGWWYYRVR
jgi:hypothetical protein